MAIIIVGNDKGGVGKSMTADELAVMATRDGVDTCLLDTDNQGTSENFKSDRAKNGIKPDLTLLKLSEDPRFELVKLAEKFELVIVDIAAKGASTLAKVARVADLVIIPCGPDQAEIDTTVATCMALKENDHFHPSGKIPFRIALNRLPTNRQSMEEENLRAMFDSYELPMFDAAVRARSSFTKARRMGCAVEELKNRDKDAKATAEMRAFYDEVVERISQTK